MNLEISLLPGHILQFGYLDSEIIFCMALKLKSNFIYTDINYPIENAFKWKIGG